jgi:hypothetical protein
VTWNVVFMVLGIVGSEVAGWLHQRWVTRHRPTMSIEEATEHLKAELAEHRRLTEEAMWQAIWDQKG